MQIPIIGGIYSDEAADFRSALPRNMIPVPKDSGINSGYLRPAEGIVQIGTGPGPDRGGINWNGVCYRVMGSNLVSVAADGSVTILGTVAGSEQVTLDYSFDRLIIAAGGNLYYWNGVLVQVTDPDLGTVIDALWVDGYTMTTDGTSLIVTDLNDPMSINPLHYGSSEVDPDNIVSLKKLHDEPHAINRYTTEAFNNIGGNLFPFQRNEGAQLARGAVGTHCCAIYIDQLAFLGGARNEPPAVWLGLNSNTTKISTREIETILASYSEAQLASAVMEVRLTKSHQWLYIHLPDQTIVYDAAASQAIQQPIWFQLDSGGPFGKLTYRARNFVWCYDKWICGDPTSNVIGQMVDTVSEHYGSLIGWEFNTPITYNNSMGAIFHQLELVTLPGRVSLGADPIVWTSYSIDGEMWSAEKSCPAGRQGDRTKRLTWLKQGRMSNWRIQKFRGTSDAHLSVVRLEAQLEPLSV